MPTLLASNVCAARRVRGPGPARCHAPGRSRVPARGAERDRAPSATEGRARSGVRHAGPARGQTAAHLSPRKRFDRGASASQLQRLSQRPSRGAARAGRRAKHAARTRTVAGRVMKQSLPYAVRWVVRFVVPARGADQILSDLEDDYARVRARRPASAARWWLLRETASVLVSYSAAPFERAGEAWPAWSRDVRLVVRGFRRGGALTAAVAAAMLAVGLLAVLVTAGLSQTLLFRQVSASYGD